MWREWQWCQRNAMKNNNEGLKKYSNTKKCSAVTTAGLQLPTRYRNLVREREGEVFSVFSRARNQDDETKRLLINGCR